MFNFRHPIPHHIPLPPLLQSPPHHQSLDCPLIAYDLGTYLILLFTV